MKTILVRSILIFVLALAFSSCSLPGLPESAPTPLSTLTTAPHVPELRRTTPPPVSTPRVVTVTRGALTAPVKPGVTDLPTHPVDLEIITTRVSKTQPISDDAGFVKIFLIALNDNGAAGKKIGCNDSAIPVNVPLADPAAPLRAALDQLLSIRSQYYGQSGLYHALFRSDLKLEAVTIQNGLATIKLTGALTLGGTCDSPRVLAQLEETALQFSTVKQVNILVNGKKLQDLLSSK
jgi:hypothetical protein